MNLALFLLGALLTLVPAGLARFDRPVQATHVVMISRAAVPTGFVVLVLALIATAAPAALELAAMSHLAELCERLIAHTVVGGAPGALVGGAVAALIAASASRGMYSAWIDQRSSYVEAEVGTHMPGEHCTLVLLDTPQMIAFSSPGTPPQVVLSRGAIDGLTALQQRVVIEHERAHIRQNHHVDLMLINAARGALRWLPGVRAGLSYWREALEWQADDHAARVVGSRHEVAATVRNWATTTPNPGLAFNAAETVDRRLSNLNSQPQHKLIASVGWLSVASLWVAGGVVVARWLVHAHAVTTAASYCPI